MKKILSFMAAATLLLTAISFTACQTNVSTDAGKADSPGAAATPAATTPASTNNGKENYSEINAGTTAANHDWYITKIDLSDFAGKTVNVSFSVNMKVVNTGDAADLTWTINGVESDGTTAKYTTVASKNFASGTTNWTLVSGTASNVILNSSGGSILYISTYNITASNFTIGLKNINVVVTEASDDSNTKTYKAVAEEDGISTKSESVNWLSDNIPSIYQTYKDKFDYIGIAAEYGNMGLACSGNKYTGTYTQTSWGTPSELYYEEIQNGIAKHANSITLGNELKPQFVLAWWNTGDGAKQTMTTFTASNGQTISVPNSLNNEKLIYATLNVAKKMGVKMRGHVLTWHSQTPDDFFAVGYSAAYTDSTKATLSNPVDEATMTARHEWYIKSVLECVANWEAANGYGTGNHLIWAWDVVNEATADDAGTTYTGTSQDWLRGSTSATKNKAPGSNGSRWYQIYGDDEFIVNAFRFANAYAPSDVKLCYNDYNEYMDNKTGAICHLVQDVQSGAAETVNGASVSPRIDVVAMQSHVGTTWPGVSAYESALKRFLDLGCDVHVSELDFSAKTQDAAVKAYGDYMTMLQKYGKNYSGANKVTNITFWGINDENSWINPSTSDSSRTYPLLFNLVDNVTTSVRTSNGAAVTYSDGTKLPFYDVGDTYKPNESFWAVINAHN